MPGTSPWIKLALLNIPVIQAAAAMNCSKKTASDRLDEAHSILETPRQSAAVGVIQASGAVRQEINRRSWQDVLLGYKRAV